MSIKHLKTFKMWDKILGGVWYYNLNNNFQFLNNIIYIFTQFFIRTYFKKYKYRYQTDLSDPNST